MGRKIGQMHGPDVQRVGRSRGQHDLSTRPGIGMKVLGRTFIDVHMQRVVCMAVVICLLRVDRQVRPLTRTLADTERPKHAQGLPQKGNQQDERAQAVGHARHFKGGSPERRSGNANTLAMSVLSG